MWLAEKRLLRNEHTWKTTNNKISSGLMNWKRTKYNKTKPKKKNPLILIGKWSPWMIQNITPLDEIEHTMDKTLDETNNGNIGVPNQTFKMWFNST